jgi:hypothetical protein
MDYGPKVEKTYGQGLPRDKDKADLHRRSIPVWPLTPAQQQYARFNGARMKQHVVDLANVAIRYRDAGPQVVGTPAWYDRRQGRHGVHDEGVREPSDSRSSTSRSRWRATGGRRTSRQLQDRGREDVELAHGVSGVGHQGDGPAGITADAVWVGIGSGADFIGRDVKGRRSSSTARSFRRPQPFGKRSRGSLRLEHARREARRSRHHRRDGRARQRQFEPEGGVRDVPNFTLSQDEASR